MQSIDMVGDESSKAQRLVPEPLVSQVLRHWLALLMPTAAVAVVAGWLVYEKGGFGLADRTVVLGADARLVPVALCVVSAAQLTRPMLTRRWAIGVSLSVAIIAVPTWWGGFTLAALWILLRRSSTSTWFSVVVALVATTPLWGTFAPHTEPLAARVLRGVGFALLALLLLRPHRGELPPPVGVQRAVASTSA